MTQETMPVVHLKKRKSVIFHPSKFTTQENKIVEANVHFFLFDFWRTNIIEILSQERAVTEKLVDNTVLCLVVDASNDACNVNAP